MAKGMRPRRSDYIFAFTKNAMVIVGCQELIIVFMVTKHLNDRRLALRCLVTLKSYNQFLVEEQLTALMNKATDETANTAKDEQLWSNFVASFKSAFTSMTEQWDAQVKLNTLKMGRGDLDLYIATFKHLARKAGLGLNSTDTRARFVQGL